MYLKNFFSGKNSIFRAPEKCIYTFYTFYTFQFMIKKHIRKRYLVLYNMVHIREHTCKECNKIYASYQSLCNHRTKFHKPNNNSIEQHEQQPITALNNIHSGEFNCRKCNKSYKHQQSRSRHEIKCDKNQEIIEKNNSIIQNQNNNSQLIENNGTMNTTNNTNNGTINNTTNITINNYGNENLSYLKDELIKKILERLTKHDDDSMKNAIPTLAQFIHFNPYYKENNNIEINSIKSKTAKKMVDGKMKYVVKDKLIKEIHTRLIDFLQNYINTHRLEITRAMTECLKHYKLKNPEYIKKVILEEINLLGYVFYKNHIDIDNELEC